MPRTATVTNEAERTPGLVFLTHDGGTSWAQISTIPSLNGVEVSGPLEQSQLVFTSESDGWAVPGPTFDSLSDWVPELHDLPQYGWGHFMVCRSGPSIGAPVHASSVLRRSIGRGIGDEGVWLGPHGLRFRRWWFELDEACGPRVPVRSSQFSPGGIAYRLCGGGTAELEGQCWICPTRPTTVELAGPR